MNLKCSICSDLLTSHSEIFGTPCGHLFHYHCLIQWIDRSQTCPQCRARTTEKTIFKIYLNVEENTETTDLAVLHNKLDNLQLQISMKNRDVKNMKEKYETVNKQNLGLLLESAIFALKDQVNYFKTKSKETKKLEEDLVKLRGKLKEIRNVEVVLAGTQDEVNNMLQNTQDPQALSILVATLKKELIESDKSKKQLKGTVKVAHAELVAFRKKVHDLKTASLQMREELDGHKNCETERQYLKQNLLELKSKCQRLSSGTANNISRVVSESPIPASRLAQSSADTSPSVVSLFRSLIGRSTINPITAQELHKIAEGAGIQFLDAPVSGGVTGASAATLTFMIGGSQEIAKKVEPYLLQMGGRIMHCGGPGAGQIAKLCMNLGAKMGLDVKTLAQVVNTSTGRCWSSDTYNPVPGIMENVPSADNYNGGFQVQLIAKDMALASNVAVSCGAPIPLGSAAHQMYRTLAAYGNGNKDFGVVYKFLQGQLDSLNK
ncbi:hypothetical protein RI129_003962 [Pyrocoelia pectoralis]|uniref:3-hydroxyisobutyrate dehydrogenase n=1 Tax=Pyrocoelia pectoralis TaxID=417401 RepID=A0AAN7ZJ22_9COLE